MNYDLFDILIDDLHDILIVVIVRVGLLVLAAGLTVIILSAFLVIGGLYER